MITYFFGNSIELQILGPKKRISSYTWFKSIKNPFSVAMLFLCKTSFISHIPT